MSPELDDWNKHAKMVLRDIQRLEEKVDELNTQVAQIRTDIAVLMLKSSLWGALGGCAAAALAFAASLLKK